MLRCQFFPTWSTNWTHSQAKSQWVILWTLINWLKAFMERQNTLDSHRGTKGKVQSQRTDTSPLQDLEWISATTAAWYWWRNRQIVYWNRIETLAIDPHKYSQLIVDKGARVLEQIDIHTKNLDTDFYTLSSKLASSDSEI